MAISPRKKLPRKGGRPSSHASVQIRDQILDIATALFLEQGYGATSIESIAAAARMSKRTFYHRFADKPALFAAVVHRLIADLRPRDETHLFEGKSLQAILRSLGTIILNAALCPQALALHRIIIAESRRFPELASVMQEQGSMNEAIERIGALLQQQHRAGIIRTPNHRFAAEQFLHMLITIPRNRALGLGEPMRTGQLGIWVKQTVDLFLHGCSAGD